jgi:hypothetical protein
VCVVCRIDSLFISDAVAALMPSVPSTNCVTLFRPMPHPEQDFSFEVLFVKPNMLGRQIRTWRHDFGRLGC